MQPLDGYRFGPNEQCCYGHIKWIPYEGEKYPNISYSLHADYAIITRYTGNAVNVVIPAQIEGLPVTHIGEHAFDSRTRMASIVLPDSITTIGKSAFEYCTGLTSIDLPDSLTSIGESAFEHCTSLTSVDFPDSLTTIGDYAFFQCYSLANADLPDTVTSVGDYTFTYCESLTDIDLPDNAVSIGSNAFAYCVSLTGAVIPNGVTTIGERAFFDCDCLSTIVIPASVTTIGDEAFSGSLSLTGFHVDENNPVYSSDDRGVLFDKEKTLLMQAPSAMEGTYTVPDSVISIGADAFECCLDLTGIDLPDSLTSIGSAAFHYCESLTSIVIPESVTSIGDWAFLRCSSLASIDLPDGLTRIEPYTFYYCENLSSIDLPDSITSIGHLAFCYCTSLTNVNIPDGVTTIEEAAFSHCFYLADIEIPASVTFIGDQAFFECVRLTGIHVDENNPNYSSDDRGVFFDKEKTVLIQAPGEMEGPYTVPEGVTAILDYAFRNCDGLTSIIIPAGVTSIGHAAFYLCRGLTEIHFRGDAPSIGEKAFDNVIAFAYFPADNDTWTLDVQQYYGGTISWCEEGSEPIVPFGLAYRICEDHVEIVSYAGHDDQVVIPSEIHGLPVTVIIDYAFYSTPCPPTVILPDSLTTIGDCAFLGCFRLTSIVIPDGVTSIGDHAFDHCSGLTSVDLPDSLTSIGGTAFGSCSSLTSIRIPDSVTSIGNAAFVFCSDLASVELPDNLTSIGLAAFSSCSSLIDIEIPGSVTSIGNGAFSDCSSLSSIEIPAGVTSIGTEAFEGCEKLTSIFFNGDAPTFGNRAFDRVTATAWYPADNATWTENVMQNYGGHITWVPCDPNHTHDYSPVVTPPTCLDPGFTMYICGCGKSYVDDYVDALGHEYVDDVCKRCGETVPNHGGSTPFTDVPVDSFYEESVLWAVENEITNGLTDTEFGPAATCNRAQVVTFLWRAAGCPEPIFVENPFVDVDAGSFYEKPVLWAVENGITNGSDATHFNPNGECNRAQVVTFLYRAFLSPDVSVEGLPFTDVPDGSWYEAPIAWAVGNSITNGLDATTFGPNAICNRAQVVTFLYRAYH